MPPKMPAGSELGYRFAALVDTTQLASPGLFEDSPALSPSGQGRENNPA